MLCYNRVKIRQAFKEVYSLKQIKSKKRVSDHGEVFTAKREVDAMLDLVDDELVKIKSTVLEPACGDGNFLIEILKCKMDTVQRIHQSRYDYEIYSMLTFSTIYGLDIQKDNVLESRKRLYDWYVSDYEHKFKTQPSKQLLKAIKFILQKNIQCADSLSMMNEKNHDLVICEWSLCDDGRMIRKDVFYKDLVKGIESIYINRYSYRWLQKSNLIERVVFQYA